FTDEELVAAVDFCHLHQTKLYVTLNILIKETELDDALAFATFLIQAGVDGIIIQDLGLLCAVRQMSPEVKINASTQMTIGTSNGVNLLERLGANRVVLARELSKNEVAAIRSNSKLELEMFVHGAMCMGWSGQCLMSSLIGGRSGNRGLCAQPCRLPYALLADGKPVTDKKPLLCMKDLCLADNIDEIKPYVDSFKIEGRMKSAEYTGIVTQTYKQALAGSLQKTQMQTMLSFFSRGGSSVGYLNGRSFRDMMDYAPSEKVTATKAQLSEIRQTATEKRRTLALSLTAKEGEPLLLFGTSGEFSATATGETCQTAKNAPFDETRAKQQLGKLGDTPFALEDISVQVTGQPFVSVSALNGLRRQVCEHLTKQICESYRRKIQDISVIKSTSKRDTVAPKLCVQVRTKEQFDAAEAMGIHAKYLSYDLFLQVGTKDDICVLPPVSKEGEVLKLNGAKRLMVQNLGQLSQPADMLLCGGERLNVTNSLTVNVLSDMGLKRITLSPELTLREMKQIIEKTTLPIEVIAYGRLPLMVMENCVTKSAYRCTKGAENLALSDRMGEQFPLVCDGCRNVLYNSVPLYMADKAEDLLSLNATVLRLMFTTENYEECRSIIAAYKAGLSGKAPHKVFERITRGHFYRGVE
ncbi:MAG: U32 family peptidase, partial [Clostridia bacterium]|nr:U32 family peptidase [Clostridia bacterium]